MTPLQEGTKKLQSSITRLTEDVISKKLIICKLRNENTMKFEQILWKKEKIIKLNSQHEELEEQKQSQRQKSTLEKEQEQNNQMNQQQSLQMVLNESTYDTKFLQIMSSYLDKTNRTFTKFGGKKQDNHGEYINSYPSINVKPQIKGLASLDTVTLRLDEKTTFGQIKHFAFLYWMLDQNQDKAPVQEMDLLNELELTDDSYSQLPLQDNVFTFYQLQGKQNLDQLTLILRKQKTTSSQVDPHQQESVKISGPKGAVQRIDSLFATSSKMTLIDPYQQFFISLPGLRQFIDEGQIHKEEEQRVHDELQQKKINVEDIQVKVEQSFQHLYDVDDSHCCILSCILVILFLTIMQYNSMLDSTLVFKKVAAFNFLFDLVQDVPGSYKSIESKNEFWDYLKIFVGKGLLDSESTGNFYRDNNEIIGSIRLRQLKMPKLQCKFYVNEYQKSSCFYKEYDQNNQYTQNSSNGESQMDSWRFFQTAQQLNQVYKPVGITTTYSGDGYVVDFQRDLTYEQFLQQIVVLQKEKFFDSFTQAVFVQFTSYSPTSNIWTYCVLILERNIQNQLIPYNPTILLFVPNLYEGALGSRNFILDIVRTLLAIILTLFTFYNLKKKNKSLNASFVKWDLSYLFVQVGGLNLAVSTLTIASFLTTLIQSSSSLKTQDLVNQNGYVDLYEEAQYYNLTFIIQGISILFICIRMAVVLKSNDNLNLIFLTLNKAVMQILAFILLLVPYFIGFVLAFQQLWGTFYADFSTFSGALSNLFRLAQGYLTTTEFIENASYSTPIFITLFYFFVIFFIQAIFQAFLIESYRTVIMTKGYPQPQQPFSFKTISRWTFSWIYCWIDRPQEEINVVKKRESNGEQTEVLLPFLQLQPPLHSPIQSAPQTPKQHYKAQRLLQQP